jgi:hypothetical protein
MRLLVAVGLGVVAIWVLVAQPSWRRNNPSRATADPELLRRHVEALSQQFVPRDWLHGENLEKCADYVARHFSASGAAVESQSFTAAGRPFRNVMGRFGVGRQPRLIVGAHYDAFEELPGADDNASAVAVLLELAAMLGRLAPTQAVDLVAYVLEEPPFFQTDQMGSAAHARSVVGEKAAYRGVIALEMVGCFTDKPGSQRYPSALLRLIYPSRGNFLAVVGRWDQGDWVKSVRVAMSGATDLPVRSIRAPALVPGSDFSDHQSYWPHGINALMVTDTAFYRNPAYHSPQDTPETLDYRRMAQVAAALFAAIESLSASTREAFRLDSGRASR